jgi:hypothetical protein
MASTISFAQQAQYEILNKSYTPNNKQTTLEIINNFGNINLAVWDKNSIAVKITLDVEGYDEKEAKKILDKIDLKTSEKSGLISFKTNLNSINTSSIRKKSFKINYEIKMPDGHPLLLTNEFGNIFMTDYSGKATINLEYGNLTAGALGELNLTHEFGKGEIESISKGEFMLEYIDEFTLVKANELQLTSEFSKIEIENVTTLNFEVEYGNLFIGEVSNYNGNAEFTSISIDKLYENFKLDAEYAGGTIELKHVSKDIKSFQLDTEFSKSEITIENGANLRFETEHSFGKLKTEGSAINFSKKMKDMSDESYSGTIGSQNDQATTTLKIKTDYGSCSIIVN